MPRLATHLLPEQIIDLEAPDRDAALRTLAEQVASLEPSVGLDALVEALREREALSTTGFGGGVAMPHVRLAGVTQLRTALGRVRDGVEFAALDGAPVHLLLLIVGPDRNKERYQRLMAHAARFLKVEGARLIASDDFHRDAVAALTDY